jgi:predicted metal-dependent peptidase
MLDTSGSISDKELIQFVSESVEILRVCKAPWVDLYLHDTECYKVWRITKTAAEDKWEVRRGGTSHVHVFKKCLEANDKPGLIVAFTDLATDFPQDAPACEVIWAHPKGYGENANIPWGIKVLVDMEDN